MFAQAKEYPAIDPVLLISKLCQKQGSAVLLLRDSSREGEIHVHRGRVVNASCNSLEGEQALFGMLMWPSPKLWLAPLLESPEVNIFSDLQFLCLDAERQALEPSPA